MTIETLAESFREANAKAGHPARIKYPKKLKDAAIEYFKANPKLTPNRMQAFHLQGELLTSELVGILG